MQVARNAVAVEEFDENEEVVTYVSDHLYSITICKLGSIIALSINIGLLN